MTIITVIHTRKKIIKIKINLISISPMYLIVKSYKKNKDSAKAEITLQMTSKNVAIATLICGIFLFEASSFLPIY